MSEILTFNGSSYIQCPDIPEITDKKFRIEMDDVLWQPSSSNQYFFACSLGTNSVIEFQLTSSDIFRYIVFGGFNDLTSFASEGLTEVNGNLVFEFDDPSNLCQLFLNGVLLASSSFQFNNTSGETTVGTGFQIGARRNNSRAANGNKVGAVRILIDDVLVRDYRMPSAVDETFTIADVANSQDANLVNGAFSDFSGGPEVPVINTIPDQTITAGESFTFDVSPFVDNDPTQYFVEGGFEDFTINNDGIISGTAPETPGTYQSFSFSAANSAGNSPGEVVTFIVEEASNIVNISGTFTLSLDIGGLRL